MSQSRHRHYRHRPPRRELDDYRDRLLFQLDRAASRYDGVPGTEQLRDVLAALREWIAESDDRALTLASLLYTNWPPLPPAPHAPARTIARERSVSAATSAAVAEA